MKKVFAIAALFFTTNINAQSKFVGKWLGELKVGTTLRLVYEIEKDGNGHKAFLKSIDQAPTPFPADSVSIHGDSVFVSHKLLGARFSGKLTNDTLISGTFFQGMSFPLELHKSEEGFVINRPQTPKPKFPYTVESVTFAGGQKDVTLAGTITRPFEATKKLPAIILVSGSGPQDRDETMFEHKPFLVLANALTKAGYVVLRYDDRGVGESSGQFANATTFDFAKDAEAALKYVKTLPYVDKKHIGIIGHSEGGMIAPMVDDATGNVTFQVLLSAPIIPIKELMKEQMQAVASSGGATPVQAVASAELFEIVANSALATNDYSSFKDLAFPAITSWAAQKDTAVLQALLVANENAIQKYLQTLYPSISNVWYKTFLGIEPAQYIEKSKGSILALFAEKDIQVLPKSNLAAAEKAFKKAKGKYKQAMVIPGVNHLYQTCKECSIPEYGQLEETFSPTAIQIILDWIKKVVSKE